MIGNLGARWMRVTNIDMKKMDLWTWCWIIRTKFTNILIRMHSTHGNIVSTFTFRNAKAILQTLRIFINIFSRRHSVRSSPWNLRISTIRTITWKMRMHQYASQIMHIQISSTPTPFLTSNNLFLRLGFPILFLVPDTP